MRESDQTRGEATEQTTDAVNETTSGQGDQGDAGTPEATDESTAQGVVGEQSGRHYGE